MLRGTLNVEHYSLSHFIDIVRAFRYIIIGPTAHHCGLRHVTPVDGRPVQLIDCAYLRRRTRTTRVRQLRESSPSSASLADTFALRRRPTALVPGSAAQLDHLFSRRSLSSFSGRSKSVSLLDSHNRVAFYSQTNEGIDDKTATDQPAKDRC